MTEQPFTKDDLKKGNALYAEWNQAKKAWRAFKAASIRASDKEWAYCLQTEGACTRFWLRHGEEVLTALEEAWERLDFLERERAAMKDVPPSRESDDGSAAEASHE